METTGTYSTGLYATGGLYGLHGTTDGTDGGAAIYGEGCHDTWGFISGDDGEGYYYGVYGTGGHAGVLGDGQSSGIGVKGLGFNPLEQGNLVDVVLHGSAFRSTVLVAVPDADQRIEAEK